MKRFKRGAILTALLSTILILLVSCFDSNESSGFSNTLKSGSVIDLSEISTEEAQATMSSTLFSKLNTNLTDFDSVVFSTDAYVALAENPNTASFLEEVGLTSRTTSIMDLLDIEMLLSDSTESNNSLQELIPSEDTTADQFAAQVSQLIETYFNEPVRNDNTIVYTANDQFCSLDEMATQQEKTRCKQSINKVSIKQVLLSETTGTMSFVINESTLITLGYSPTEIYLELDLASAKVAFLFIDSFLSPAGDTPLELPENCAGKIRLSFGAPAEGDSLIKLAITKAIDVSGFFDGTLLNVSIARSPSLLSILTEKASTKVAVTIELNKLAIVTEDFLEFTDGPGVMAVKIDGINANVSTDDSGQIVALNTGITDTITVKFAESEGGILAAEPTFSVLLDEFDATMSSDLSSLEFNTDFNFDLSMILFDAPIGIAVSADKDTNVNLNIDGGITEVVTGRLNLTGTEINENQTSSQSNTVATDGECLTDSTRDGIFLHDLVSCSGENSSTITIVPVTF